MGADQHDLSEFQTLAGLFALWQEESLTCFAHRVTQGFVAANNPLAKAFERHAFGYRYADNLGYHLRSTNPHPLLSSPQDPVIPQDPLKIHVSFMERRAR